MENIEQIIKALSNSARRDVLHWLKSPKQYFAEQVTDIDEYGVCNGRIQERLGLSQSTTSHYLKMMEQCGLLVSKRKGQWTFYRRNEKTITQLVKYIQENF